MTAESHKQELEDTVTSPMTDSVQRAESKGSNSAMVTFASKILLGAMRMQNQLELRQLKARVEGTTPPVAVPPRP